MVRNNKKIDKSSIKHYKGGPYIGHKKNAEPWMVEDGGYIHTGYRLNY